ncbi:hypothetical protein [Streptacidiphilus neutrinimicus]|uniref:hypothetical protein n=1 Tax=Streptacidiphilus neutrinimicus TaxID=105420 RepID=UPI001476E0DF|nr:hypothetical protein [Streptacidiphilus neutrinimicus]
MDLTWHPKSAVRVQVAPLFCILRIATGRWREVLVALYVVAGAFAFYYLMPALGIGQ